MSLDPRGDVECTDSVGKKVMGRKRHIVVDTGMLLAIVVQLIQDRDGARLVIDKLHLRLICTPDTPGSASVSGNGNGVAHDYRTC